MTAKEHYANHLGNFYSWMTGDFDTIQNEFLDFLRRQGIYPSTTKIAIDLGAGHGLQTVPLATLGFKVVAVDFNQQLLDELKENTKGLSVDIINEDIRRVSQFGHYQPELILCCGDTLAHLESKGEVEQLIKDISATLVKGGMLLLSFRDYSEPLIGNNRFIPVKGDDTRMLTCILDYEENSVTVTDLLHEKAATGWLQKVSAYKKVRLTTAFVTHLLEANSLRIECNVAVNRLITIVAKKD